MQLNKKVGKVIINIIMQPQVVNCIEDLFIHLMYLHTPVRDKKSKKYIHDTTVI